MKITKDRLKQLIKEEYKALNERYELPPIPRGMAYPDQDGIYPMSGDDGFPMYEYQVYDIPKYKEFFDWLRSNEPQGPPQGPPEEYFDPDPQPEPSIRMEEGHEGHGEDDPRPMQPGTSRGGVYMPTKEDMFVDTAFAEGMEAAVGGLSLHPVPAQYARNEEVLESYIRGYKKAFEGESRFGMQPGPGTPSQVGLEEGQEDSSLGAWERAMASIRRLSDRAKTGGTALATKAGREIKMHINQLKKDGSIDEPTWRKARRALYKDKTGDMAIQILVDAVGPGEVEGALGGGFDDEITPQAPAPKQNNPLAGDALSPRAKKMLARMAAEREELIKTGKIKPFKESKLTKSTLKQLILEELNKD